MVFMVTTSTYYQELLWGGRPQFVRELTAEISADVATDARQGLVNATSEMYFNAVLHRASSRVDLNVRWLSSSYGFPVRDTPGHWTVRLETKIVGIHSRMPCGATTCEGARPKH
jgi:hypothetical protein